MQQTGRKHERILQVSGHLTAADSERSFQEALKTTLQWAESKMGTRLPPQSWQGGAFEHDLVSSTLQAVNLPLNNNGLYWAMEFRHPCTSALGRVWNTEVTLAKAPQEKHAHFGLRLNAISTLGTEAAQDPAPLSIPHLLREVIRKGAVQMGGYAVSSKPLLVDEDADALRLIEMIENRDRILPLVLITLPKNTPTDERHALINPYRLAEGTQGLAHVAVIGHNAQQHITKRYEALAQSVFNGGVKVYRPGFEAVNAFRQRPGHPLFTPHNIQRHPTPQGFEDYLRKMVHEYSVSELHPGAGALPDFKQVRKVYLDELEKTKSTTSNPDLSGRLEIANKRLDTLNEQVEAALSLASEEEKKREELEETNLQLELKIEQLQAQLAEKLAVKEPPIILETINPQMSIEVSNSVFPDLSLIDHWAKACLPGRIILHPRAVAAAQTSEYANPDLIFQGLLLLGNEYRDMRLQGENGDRRLRDAFSDRANALSLHDSLSAAPDTLRRFRDIYNVSIGKKTLLLDKHLGKGNSRDPRHCLRIYYAWDETQRQVIVGHLPSHLKNAHT